MSLATVRKLTAILLATAVSAAGAACGSGPGGRRASVPWSDRGVRALGTEDLKKLKRPPLALEGGPRIKTRGAEPEKSIPDEARPPKGKPDLVDPGPRGGLPREYLERKPSQPPPGVPNQMPRELREKLKERDSK